MDKRTATLTLTEKLQQMEYVTIVTEDPLKSFFLEKAKSSVLDFGYGKSQIADFEGADISSDRGRYLALSYFKTKCPEANYLFAKENKMEPGTASCKSIITPAAIIGKAEERILKKECYKDVPYDICRAFEVLKIPNIIKFYEAYLSLSSDDSDFKKFQLRAGTSMLYRSFKDGDTVEIGDVVQGTQTKKYYVVKTIQSEGITGSRYLDAELKNLDCKDLICPNESMIPIYKSYPKVFLEFIELVFSLPKEDQNIDINEKLLHSLPNSNTLIEILYNKYTQGDNFQRYFNAINETAQKETLRILKSIRERNPVYDQFLWDKGFKEVNLDYIQIYKENANNFIEYFKSKKQDDKKTILKSIMNCDYTNKAVVDWLDENEIELVREVSMDG